ncbi:hypothetical protein CS053_09905 [Rhodanobacter glycinis]|uniref:Uncharacterized protein n=1 Tax=Rhodanobacter glycinis TaxID=582702 RepID=A0A5B9E3E6_9GAMM|nr:hypothetical protein [Rhodanobacter glycinis]QEE24777.1 hypothetical protein CS053_09905 [Rhodanobacter glycinis]
MKLDYCRIADPHDRTMTLGKLVEVSDHGRECRQMSDYIMLDPNFVLGFQDELELHGQPRG